MALSLPSVVTSTSPSQWFSPCTQPGAQVGIFRALLHQDVPCSPEGCLGCMQPLFGGDEGSSGVERIKPRLLLMFLEQARQRLEAGELALPDDAEIGEIVDCGTCGTELEVVDVDPPAVEHHQVVGVARRLLEVVEDREYGDALLRGEAAHQLEELELMGDVEEGGGLVAVAIAQRREPARRSVGPHVRGQAVVFPEPAFRHEVNLEALSVAHVIDDVAARTRQDRIETHMAQRAERDRDDDASGLVTAAAACRSVGGAAVRRSRPSSSGSASRRYRAR